MSSGGEYHKPLTEYELELENLLAVQDAQIARSKASLRDHFAGLAMQAITGGGTMGWIIEHGNDVAETAYSLADDMLKAREVKP